MKKLLLTWNDEKKQLVLGAIIIYNNSAKTPHFKHSKRFSKILSSAASQNKTVSSHSFRFRNEHINALTEKCGTPVAQRMVKHQSVESTAVYTRDTFDKRDTKRRLKKVAKRKQENFARHKASNYKKL